MFCRCEKDPAIESSFLESGRWLAVPAFCKFSGASVNFFLKERNTCPPGCRQVIETEADKLNAGAFDNYSVFQDVLTVTQPLGS